MKVTVFCPTMQKRDSSVFFGGKKMGSITIYNLQDIFGNGCGSTWFLDAKLTNYGQCTKTPTVLAQIS
jgi:hypothetical protein